jgi:hypothetical protein
MDELKRLIELLTNALADLEKLRAVVDAFRQIDPADIERLRKAAKTLPARLDEGHAAMRAELAEAADIAKRLADQGPPAPGPGAAGAGVMATDLAKGFRSVIQTLQNEVGQGDLGDVGTIIKSLDVELKGLVVIADQQPTIVPPTPDQPIDPNLLSTIRMSFASVPLQRAANREKPPG